MKKRERVRVAMAHPPDQRLLEPRIRDWVSDAEWATHPKNQAAGRDLAALAAPRYREAAADWFREWQESHTPSEVVRVDFKTAQRLAAQPDPDAVLVRWARGVSVGSPIHWRP